MKAPQQDPLWCNGWFRTCVVCHLGAGLVYRWRAGWSLVPDVCNSLVFCEPGPELVPVPRSEWEASKW
ncbi:hypothetical protein CesoFtcFv8_013240 [Champsocephalus esox]|uniref:Uncharacterized protein n=1 Tax=Champsocephalus esox TaxID=159716 RepID=A0AAN8BZ38_9TELE|nr:hypothetical protein CesoFtcFv8_013240 [Champsocephalus esox]